MALNKKKTDNLLKALIVFALALAIGVVIYARNSARSERSENPVIEDQAVTAAPPDVALPRLVDLGMDKCIPCKMMAPMLEELKKEYAGRMDVEFIDVGKNPDAGRAYRVRMIPTQIFFAPDGKELFRHEGFYSREDILGKWKSLGFEFDD